MICTVPRIIYSIKRSIFYTHYITFKSNYVFLTPYTNIRIKLFNFQVRNKHASPSLVENPENDKFRLSKHIHYEKLKERDKRFGPVVTAAKNRKSRDKRKIILLEGKLLIKTAIQYNITIKSIFFTKVEHLEGIPLEDSKIELFKVQYSNMKLYSDVSTPPGIMAVCSMPEFDFAVLENIKNRRILILDNIRDPGNMGTLLRSASGAGFHVIIALKGCVDLWEPKVLRSSSGASFIMPAVNDVDWKMLRNYLPDNCTMFIANNNMETYEEVDETCKLSSKFPISHESEVFSDMDYTNKSIALYIGGETHGISNQAFAFSKEYNGCCVSIPLSTSVESLNAAVAGSIIMFEIQRQIRDYTTT